MADHQVVDAVDGTGQALFDGQDAVLAQAAFDGAEYVLKSPAVHDGGITDHFFAGQLGIGAFHDLAGDHGFLREKGGHGGRGFPDLAAQLAFRLAVQLLTEAAVVQQQMVQGAHALLVFLSRQFRHLVQQVPFPLAVQDGQVVFFLYWPMERATSIRRQ